MKTVESTNSELKIEFIEPIEPNNGRMLWRVNLFRNNINVNSKVFKNDWNCLNYSLKLWEFESSDWYYIPIEGESVLINKNTFQISELKYQNVSTARFKGNKIDKNKLIEIFTDSILITNAITKESIEIDWKLKGILKSIKLINDNELEIRYEDLDIEELKTLTYQTIMTMERIVELEDEEIVELKSALETIEPLISIQRMDEKLINNLYTCFLPTSIWDDYLGEKGEQIGNKMLSKIENIKFGIKEIVNL
jgi:hypothetical protein